MLKSIALASMLAFSAPLAVDTAPEAADINMNLAPFTVQATWAYEIRMVGDVYHVYLEDTVIESEHYRDLVHGLRVLDADDEVIFHVNSFGGSVHSGLQLITAMEDSKAHITTKVESPSYSMGALIACAGDTMELDTNSYLMFHTYSGGFQGKGSDTRTMVEALDRLMTRVMTHTCSNVLTPEQIEDIMRGIDVYIHPGD